MRHYTRGRFSCDFDCFNCQEDDCKAVDNKIIQHESLVKKTYTVDDDIPKAYKAELLYFDIVNENNFKKVGNRGFMLHPIQLADILDDFELFSMRFDKVKSPLVFIAWLKKQGLLISEKLPSKIAREFIDWANKEEYRKLSLSCCIHFLNNTGYLEEDAVNEKYKYE